MKHIVRHYPLHNLFATCGVLLMTAGKAMGGSWSSEEDIERWMEERGVSPRLRHHVSWIASVGAARLVVSRSVAV